MSTPDSEKKTILQDIPEEPASTPGSGYFKIPAPNAYICKDKHGRLGIYPVDGGWLGVQLEHLQADIAPFSD